ncbi:uncharacterized protein G2W53_041134 [Senna tora]|uniref:Uncharacterized protein n=1 Tax=Senna tora TaxID=362788 RepID=A0A834VXR1_9FABA|nr:uncharacterized protein G2W53_041134 [Senna tora]
MALPFVSVQKEKGHRVRNPYTRGSSPIR